MTRQRPRIVIVGAGFAGHQAAKTLSREVRDKAEIVLLNPTDYFLYLPLLPQVAAGILEPRRVTVSLPGTLPRVRLVLGEADRIDLASHRVHYTGPEGDTGELEYDRLVLAVGSVNKLLPIPGVSEYAHGFRGLPEALYLRDHVTRQIELAAATGDPDECAARCTFVVVGAATPGPRSRPRARCSPTPSSASRAPGDTPGTSRAGCSSTSRRASCPNWTGACRRRRTRCCAGAGSTYGRGRPSRRPPRKGSGWTTASSSARSP